MLSNSPPPGDVGSMTVTSGSADKRDLVDARMARAVRVRAG